MGTVLWRGSSSLQEQANSPAWTFGSKIACARTFRGPYATAKSSAPAAGSLGTGDYAGMVVTESSIIREKGASGILSIKYEWGSDQGQPSQGSQLPPDECSVDLDQLERPLELHPRYDDLLDYIDIDGADTYLGAVRLLIQNFDQYREDFWDAVKDEPLALELYTKLIRGFTNYVLYVPVYRWRIYAWLPLEALAGGWREIPYGPITVPNDVAWLRQGDKLNWTGAHWVLERSWKGAPEWDTDIYEAK